MWCSRDICRIVLVIFLLAAAVGARLLYAESRDGREHCCVKGRAQVPDPISGVQLGPWGPQGKRGLEGFAKLSVLSGRRNFLMHFVSCRAVLGSQQNGVENTESSHLSAVPHYQHPHREVHLSQLRNPQRRLVMAQRPQLALGVTSLLHILWAWTNAECHVAIIIRSCRCPENLCSTCHPTPCNQRSVL